MPSAGSACVLQTSANGRTRRDVAVEELAGNVADEVATVAVVAAVVGALLRPDPTLVLIAAVGWLDTGGGDLLVGAGGLQLLALDLVGVAELATDAVGVALGAVADDGELRDPLVLLCGEVRTALLGGEGDDGLGFGGGLVAALVRGFELNLD